MSIAGLLFLVFHILSGLTLVRKFVKNPAAELGKRGRIELSRDPTGSLWDPIMMGSAGRCLLVIEALFLQEHPRRST